MSSRQETIYHPPLGAYIKKLKRKPNHRKLRHYLYNENTGHAAEDVFVSKKKTAFYYSHVCLCSEYGKSRVSSRRARYATFTNLWRMNAVLVCTRKFTLAVRCPPHPFGIRIFGINQMWTAKDIAVYEAARLREQDAKTRQEGSPSLFRRFRDAMNGTAANEVNPHS